MRAGLIAIAALRGENSKSDVAFRFCQTARRRALDLG